MKKTIIINIGNSIIHIEEDAYEILTTYLNEIKYHFSQTADHFEIVTDIENRIAEMFAEILQAENKQVINMQDVNIVKAQMGNVKDFEQDDLEEEIPYAASYTTDKKLFRDMDSRIIAGVCSGIGHYINLDAKWIRVFFFLAIFIGGSGIIAYLILWVIMPKAISRLEKMEMRGEPVTLQGFKRNFDDEMLAVKENLKKANHQMQPLFKRLGNFIGEFVEFVSKFLGAAVKKVLKVIAGIVAVFGILFMLFILFVIVAFLGFWDADSYQYFPMNAINEAYQKPLMLAGFIIVFIPILALVLFAIRVAFSKRTLNRTASFALLIVWLGSIVFGVFLGAKISSEFKESAAFSQTTEIKKYPVYTLTLDQSKSFTKEDSLNYKIDAEQYKGRIILDNEENGPFVAPKNIRFKIEKSDTDKVTLLQNFTADGRTFEMALKNAQNIRYDFLQKDSLLSFSPFLQLLKKTKWRNQEVILTLKVPKNTRLIISGDLNRYLEGYNLWYCQNDEDNEHANSVWVMTEDGLKCKDEALYKERTER